VLFVNDRPAAFGGMLHRPHPRVRDIWGLSRLVTLPDWQGLGLAFVLTDRLAAAYKAAGRRFHTYPAHPALIHAFDRSPVWAMTKKPGQYNIAGKTSSLRNPAARAASNRAAPGFANSGWGKDAAARQAASPTNRDQIEAAQAAGVPFRGSLPVASGPNRPKRISNANNPTSRMAHRDAQPWIQGSRINAIFEYVGEAGSKEDAECLLS
jgi:GNAT superfamily N-acetyltransferase